MNSYEFWLVDAFSASPYSGNLAALVFGADELEEGRMQEIARHLNLSETVFFCEPLRTAEGEGADYRVRIFTPGREVPFAGHPTIASAFAHARRTENGRTGPYVLRQQCGLGIVEVAVSRTDDTGESLFTIHTSQATAAGAGLDRSDVAKLVGCQVEDISVDPIEICSAGLPWIVARVRGLEALEGAVPNAERIAVASLEREAVGLTAYCEGAILPGCTIRSRAWGPAAGIPEDPTCGSGNAAVAIHASRYLYADRPSFSYSAEQGLEIGRRGILHLTVERPGGPGAPPKVSLGGQASVVARGELDA